MQGGCLQMGCRPSKAANTAAAMCMRSETDSDYIAQAKVQACSAHPRMYRSVSRLFLFYIFCKKYRKKPGPDFVVASSISLVPVCLAAQPSSIPLYTLPQKRFPGVAKAPPANRAAAEKHPCLNPPPAAAGLFSSPRTETHFVGLSVRV